MYGSTKQTGRLLKSFICRTVRDSFSAWLHGLQTHLYCTIIDGVHLVVKLKNHICIASTP
uniref:Uncharacterized protein n=1 Tax=Anguilla anguilla TaxID=7936 RepID=A0A0E9TJ87_ANGAN